MSLTITKNNSLTADLETPPAQGTSLQVEFQPPPYCETVDGPDYTNSMVSIEVHSGYRVKGKLVNYDVNSGVLEIQEQSKHKTTSFNIQDLKFFRLEKPYQMTMDGPSKGGNVLPLPFENSARSFQIYFKDRTELFGKTFGSRVDKNGVHFYEQQKQGRKWRYCSHLFVSKEAIENYIIGEQIGGMLVKGNAISQDVLDEVLAAQQNDRAQMLGEFLLKNNAVDAAGLEKALARQKQMPNVPLGEILVSENLLSEAQLEDALKEQKRQRKKSLGEILVDKGVIQRYQIQQCLAKKMGVPFVNLRNFPVDTIAMQLLDADTAYSHQVLPLYLTGGKLAVAIEDPTNWRVIDFLKTKLHKHIEPVMASAEDINWGLHFYYSVDDLNLVKNQPAKVELKEEAEYDSTIFALFNLAMVSDASMVKIVNKIVEDAYKQNVSDIHIEPGLGDESVTVRFRKGGALTVYYKFPANLRQALVARLKIMARLDITNKRKVQEGKVNFKNFGPIDIELRVTTIPIAGGAEDVVLNIVNGARKIPLNAIGLNRKNLSQIRDVVSNPQGMFLVCGPTGSGKSTTLHAILDHLNQTNRKIYTAEEPLGIVQSGLRQVEIDEKAGETFASALDSFLKADPDIIMLSDLPDANTLNKSTVAALTGHLVLSSLPTSGIAESLSRLMDMGMDPFNLADSLLGILSQRLVRTLCTSCKQPYQAKRQEIELLAIEFCREKQGDNKSAIPDQVEIGKQIKRWEVAYSSGLGLTLFKAPGCKDCMETGYRGHIGVHELLMNFPNIKQLIIKNASAKDIQQEGLLQGMLTHKQDGIEKVMLGYTDFAEVRVL